ncbi:hypothetical protein [Streptomyces nigrescens]|uniref:hypothetical protein n=1 Tax=Streptomyces nigrescens TaxID=1920 RepID=UPI003475B442
MGVLGDSLEKAAAATATRPSTRPRTLAVVGRRMADGLGAVFVLVLLPGTVVRTVREPGVCSPSRPAGAGPTGLDVMVS